MLPGCIDEITAEWLDRALHANEFLDRGTHIRAIRVTPMAAGEGFQSDMARISVEYNRPSVVLPESMIAKLPTSYAPANYVAMLFNTYEREIRFYREIAPQSPLRTPELILGEFDAEAKRYVLLLQDCGCYRQVDQLAGLTEGQVRQVIERIADFHACWWDSPVLPTLTWMSGPRSAAAFALADLYRECWETAVKSPNFLSALPPGGREAGDRIHRNVRWMMDEAAPTDNLTITHFDFRGDNLFFDESNPTDPVIAFDWQATSKYRGPLDIAYLVGGSIRLELRRRIEKDLLEQYYARLLEKGVTGYRFTECQQDYNVGLLVYAYIPALAYSRLDMISPRAAQLARTLTERHFSAIVDNKATDFMPP